MKGKQLAIKKGQPPTSPYTQARGFPAFAGQAVLRCRGKW